MKKVSEAHFQKVLKRQKSANSTKKVLKRQFEKCSNDNFYKTLYFNRKSFCNILGTEWHLLPLEKTKIINSSLYEHFFCRISTFLSLEHFLKMSF